MIGRIAKAAISFLLAVALVVLLIAVVGPATFAWLGTMLLCLLIADRVARLIDALCAVWRQARRDLEP